MTVASETNRYSYNGDDVTTAFAFNSEFLVDEDLVVVLVASDGTETVQTITTHYTVSGGGGSSGTVTMVTPPATGEKLVIYCDPEVTQATDYPTGGDFPASAHEDALDKLTLIARRTRDLQERSITVSEGYTGSADFTLPAPSAEKVIGWNAAGDELTLYDILNSNVVTTTAWSRSLLDDASASEGRTTLGLGTAATVNTGTSGATIPLLNGTNTWAAAQTFADDITFSGTDPVITASDGDLTLTVDGQLLHGTRYARQTTTANTDYAWLRSQREQDHSGGTAGWVCAGIRHDTYVTTAADTFEWGIVGVIHSQVVNDGEDTGIYAQFNRETGGGGGFAFVAENRDKTGNADPSQGMIAGEFDIFGNGTDASLRRVAIDVVVGKHNSGGAACVAGYGLRIGPQDADTSLGSYTNGAYLYGNMTTALNLASAGSFGIYFSGAKDTGIDLSNGTHANAALRLKDGEWFSFVGTDAYKMRHNNSSYRWEYLQGSTVLFAVPDVSSPVNGIALNGSATTDPVQIYPLGSDTNIDLVAKAKGSGSVKLQDGSGNTIFEVNSTGVGVNGATPAAKPTITGSRGSNAALANLLTALATRGDITDSTTA